MAQYFSGRSPGPVGMVSRAVCTPDPLLRISLYTPCVCVSCTLRAEAGVPAGVSANPLMCPSAGKWTAGPGGTLPGNTIAKTLTAWSGWETVTASGRVLALQKNTTQRREGKREGGRAGVGSSRPSRGG